MEPTGPTDHCKGKALRAKLRDGAQRPAPLPLTAPIKPLPTQPPSTCSTPAPKPNPLTTPFPSPPLRPVPRPGPPVVQHRRAPRPRQHPVLPRRHHQHVVQLPGPLGGGRARRGAVRAVGGQRGVGAPHAHLPPDAGRGLPPGESIKEFDISGLTSKLRAWLQLLYQFLPSTPHPCPCIELGPIGCCWGRIAPTPLPSCPSPTLFAP